MWNFNKIKQFQLIQENKYNYTLILSGAKNIYSDGEILDVLRSFLGQDAIINIKHVDEIPPLKSGKFKPTICNYQPN